MFSKWASFQKMRNLLIVYYLIIHVHSLKNIFAEKTLSMKSFFFYFYQVGEEAPKFHFEKKANKVSPDTGCNSSLYMFNTFS